MRSLYRGQEGLHVGGWVAVSATWPSSAGVDPTPRQLHGIQDKPTVSVLGILPETKSSLLGKEIY